MISRRGGILLTLLAAAALVVAVTAAWRLLPDSSGAGASARAGAQSGASDPGDQVRALKWGPLGKLADGGDVGVPVVAFDPVVGTLAVWPSGDVLAYRIKPPGGSWDSVQVISASSGARRTETEAVSVATDSHGTVTVAWLQMEVPQRRVQLMVTTRDSSGRWSQPTALEQATWTSPLEMAPIEDPRLTVGPDGSAAVVWTTWWAVDPNYDESDVIGRARAAYRTKDGRWHRRFNFDTNTGGEDVDIDAHGVATFTVVDANGSPPVRGVELRTLRCVSGRWQRGETIAANGGASDIEVAADGSTASVVFMRPSRDSNAVLASHLEDGSWTTPVRIAPPPPPSNYYSRPRLTMSSGVTTIVLTSWTGPVRAVTHTPGHHDSPPRTIAGPSVRPGSDREVLGLWANETGQTLAIWGPRGNDQGWKPYASYQSKGGGTWTAPTALFPGRATSEDTLFTQGIGGVSAVVYPNGSAMALWSDGQRILMRSLGTPG